MVFLLIISLAILFIIGIGFYFLLRSTSDRAEQILPPSPDFHGLFGADQSSDDEKKKRLASIAREQASKLIERAQAGDRSALMDANQTGAAELYDHVLDEFVQRADSDSKLLSLMSYVAQHELPVTSRLAKAVVMLWQKNPDRGSTSKALHFVALSDDANLYGQTVEHSLELWRAGKLGNVSAVELRALFDGEFWILSARTRSSGAGFVLKRTLDSARRELEAAASTNQ